MNSAEPTVQECENFLSYRNDKFKCIDIAGSVNASELVLRKMAEADFNGYEYLIRIAILENPNCPEDLALSLMRNATDVKERDRAYGYWQHKYAIPNRGDKFKVAAKPEFPSQLIGSSSNDIEEVAKGFLAVMPAIAEYLWFELASAKLVQLAYWADDFYGDTFGLIGLHSEFDSQLYRVLGRGYFTDWIERDGIISQTIGFDRLANEAEEFISEKDWADETCDGEPYLASLLGYAGAYGDLMNHLTLNRDHPMWLEIVEEMFMDDPTSWDYEVTITSKPDWNGQTWAELSGTEQVHFVSNIEKLLPHPYLGEWGFVRHFLSLFEIHPGTKSEPLALITNLLGASKIKKGPVTENLAKNLIDSAEVAFANSDLILAERLLIDAHEQAKSSNIRDLATLTILENILIPTGRFSEAEMWCRSIIASTSRKELRDKVIALNTSTQIIRATKQNLWKSLDISGEMQQSGDQQYHYNRIVKYLSVLEKADIPRDTMSTWPGPGFTGLINGLWNEGSLIAQLGCLRETAASAAFDFLNYIWEEPLGSEERAPTLAEAPYADYSDDKLIRLSQQNDPWALKEYGLRLDRSGNRDQAIECWQRAADLGNHPSLRNLGVVAMQNKEPRVVAEFFKKSIELGSRTAFHGLANVYEEFAPELVEPTLLEGVRNGDVVAMNNLGVRKQNELLFSEAVIYYRRAAEFGDPVAAANLANLLELASNFEESRIWLERAEDSPEPETARILENVRRKIDYSANSDEGSDKDDPALLTKQNYQSLLPNRLS